MEISTPDRARSHRSPQSLLLLAVAALLALAGLGTSAQEVPDPEDPNLSPAERIGALITRIEYEQTRLKTLHSDFAQLKESELLLEPEESKGRFWFRSPDAVRWDFSEPDETRVVIRDGVMLTWFKQQGTAEKVDVGGRADRIMEYLSATNSLETLQRYFTIQAVFPKDGESPYRLHLEPRFKRVRKRLESMKIHLDRQGYFPVYVEYVEPGGDRTEFTFENVEKNIELGDELFAVDLPEDVEVRTLELGAG